MSGIIEIIVDRRTVGMPPEEQFFITVDDGLTPVPMICTPTPGPTDIDPVNGNNALIFEMDTMLYHYDNLGVDSPEDFIEYLECDENFETSTNPLSIDKPACYHIDNQTGMGIMVFYRKGLNTAGTSYTTKFQETLNTNGDTYIQLDSDGNTTGFSDIPCCVHQDTQILTNHGYKCIKDIDSSNDVKLQCANGDFIDLLYNIRYIPTNKFIMISKDSLGQNMPSEDLYIVEGHPLNIDGKEILCDDLINDDTIKKVVLDQPVFVYSLCAKERVPIKMNNVFVYTWEQNEWESYASKHNIGHIKL